MGYITLSVFGFLLGLNDISIRRIPKSSNLESGINPEKEELDIVDAAFSLIGFAFGLLA